MTCPVCGGGDLSSRAALRDRSSAGDPRQFELVRCAACDLRFVDPPLPDEELAGYYQEEFYGTPSLASETALRLFLALRARVVLDAGAARGRLLDVGAGAGSFLEAMRSRGFEVTGVEPSQAGRRRAAELGLDVRASLDEVPPGPYDVITLWHVAEHLRDPVALLSRLVALAAPGATVVVAVPNAASVQARLFGERWFHLDVPRHQLQFSARSLGRLLVEAGLELRGLRRFSLEYDGFGLLQSAYNLLPIEHNALYRRLKLRRPLASFDRRTRAVLGLTAPALPLVAGAAMASEWALARLGLNGTLTAVARPRAGGVRV